MLAIDTWCRNLQKKINIEANEKTLQDLAKMLTLEEVRAIDNSQYVSDAFTLISQQKCRRGGYPALNTARHVYHLTF